MGYCRFREYGRPLQTTIPADGFGGAATPGLQNAYAIRSCAVHNSAGSPQIDEEGQLPD